jgi:hypothetical protein
MCKRVWKESGNFTDAASDVLVLVELSLKVDQRNGGGDGWFTGSHSSKFAREEGWLSGPNLLIETP